MRRELRRREYDGAQVEAALERLSAGGALDDRRLSERFARSRLTHAGLGQHRVRQGLRVRGLGPDDLEAGLHAALQQVSEADALERLARLYWSRRRAAAQPRERLRRLWAFLLRRGFPAELVRQRLTALWPRWRDALDGLEPAEPPE